MLKTITLLFSLCVVALCFAQRGKDNSYTVSSAGTQLNAYTSVTASVAANATAITVGSNTLTNSFFTNALAAGDLLMIIQMQGATMDVDVTPTASWGGHYTVPNGHQLDWNTNLDLWGNVTAYNNAGKYELVEVRSVTGGTTINLMCGLVNSYTASGHVQVIRVPRLVNLTLNANTSVVPALWDGITGGVVVLEVDGNVVFNTGSTISATGYGFRGGVCENASAGSPPGGGAASIGYAASDNPIEGAEKGEGIGGFYTEYDALYSRYCKSAPANGGGGAGNHNSGGGGGSNVGTGAYTGKGNPVTGYTASWNLESAGFAASMSSGGGRGGYSYSTSAQNPTTTGPNSAAWSGDYRRNEGGLGGHALTYDATRLFMGGGGGAGDANTNPVQGGAGGRGGGIVCMTVYGTISGPGTIQANGAVGQNANPNGQVAAAFSSTKYGNDGAGGAGGGGVVAISNGTAIPATVALSATGGNGGNQAMSYGNFVGNPTMEGDGPGGGGAGGMLAFTSGTPVQVVTGGNNGTTNSTHMTLFPPNGATKGAAGMAGLPFSFFNITAPNASICSGSSTTLTATVAGTLPAAATLTWYSTQFGTVVLGTGATYTTPVLTSTTTYYVGTCPGTFRVPVTVTVGGPSISGTATITNVTCSTPGSITGLTTSGGVPSVTISWNGLITPGMDLTNASAGTYNVLVTDNIGCTATSGPYTITSTGGPSINTTNMVVTNESCLGNDGSIAGITASGTGLVISWSNTASTLDITGLSAGSYTLTVTDNLGCTASAGPIAVNQDAGPVISTTNLNLANATCGNPNGSITGITASGTALTYEWNGNPSGGADLTAIPAGNYTLVVEDNIGCTATAGPYTITNVAGPTISTANMTLTDEHCGQSDGAISGIQINGGTTPYTISWNGGAYSTLNLAGIPAGNYTLSVSDANGCPATSGPHVIQAVAGPSVSTTNMVITPESCLGNDGSITGITASGSGLTYQWNFLATPSASLTNAAAGTYGLLVTDGFGCMVTSGPHTISGAVPMNLDSSNLVITPSSCAFDDGTISGLTVTGGVNPGVSWSNSETTLDIAGLAAATYTITVTDDQNCNLTASFTVGTVSGPVISTANMVITGDHCDQGDGAINGITVSGGTAPYYPVWDANATLTNDLPFASDGDHTLVITDGNGCTASVTVTVPVLAGPTVDESNLQLIAAGCGLNTGGILGLQAVGTGPFTYAWDNDASTIPDILSLAAGTYSLTVTDAFGCTYTTTPYVIVSTAKPVADFTITPNPGAPNEPVVFTSVSSSDVTTWQWIIYNAAGGTASTSAYTFPDEGTYPVYLIVTNAAGCQDTITKLVTISGELVIPNVVTRNEDGINDVFFIKNLEEHSELVILNRWGNKVFESGDYKNDWKGTDPGGERLSEGVYTYQLINAEGKVWQGFVHLLNQ